ncbi:MAG TPA: hypothetical protein VGR00_02385 [Thermoanaerobaculia bacterium]|jgi:hypothetical protein|nr:hypothetical protein [Thermoanaerobaculia bacterium]
MNVVARLVYVVFGTLAIGLGIVALVAPALALPRMGYSPLAAHLVNEQGAEAVFIGLMAFWCVAHFDERRPVHYALLVFALLFAGIHWAEYFHGRRQVLSPVVNSVPFVLFAVTAPRGRRA